MIFSLRIIQLSKWLGEKKEYDFAKQIFRSGTSIGANVDEALAGISKPDFVTKMSIASKEARETNFWLRLLRDSKIISTVKIQNMIDDSNELIRILTAIVKTGQNKK